MIATRLRQAASISAIALAAAAPARAADSSAWDGDARSGMRLIAFSQSRGAPDAALRAGVELRLARGWKTYWRYPGDSGVAPRFDFAQSMNVKSVTVLWPFPHRYSDEAGTVIGYKDGVIFPLRVVPQDGAQPVTLRLKLDYAACEKICVPAEGGAELALAGGPSAHDGALAAAEARVPKPVALGAGETFAIRAVRREAGASSSRIAVDVAAPEHSPVDLFVEGPTPDWALPVPAAVAGAPAGERRFAFDLVGLPPKASAEGAILTLTAVAGETAIEVKVGLD